MSTESAVVRREVPADLIEMTPDNGALGQWILATPLLLFLGWLWVDAFHLLSPLSVDWLNTVIGLLLYGVIVVLPLGYLAHRLVLALPRLFQRAGWNIQPLVAVAPAEQYLVRYRIRQKHWAANSWRRVWLRAAQGWVFLEIAAILFGAVGMIPLFFSAVEFGFGQ
jgi:hypothetical protein